MTERDPILRFQDAFARAAAAAPAPADYTAAALGTSDAAGRTSVRMVLVRFVDARGFVFFTNYESRKAAQLESNAFASLCFYWYWLDEQIRIEGTVARITAEESDAYFASRPRGSQVGAWASAQSRPLTGRPELESRYHECEQRFGDGPVPRPGFWGGYRIVPDLIEFWKAGAYRLHDRLLYVRAADGWKVEALYP